jgi:hypothetical protein
MIRDMQRRGEADVYNLDAMLAVDAGHSDVAFEHEGDGVGDT